MAEKVGLALFGFGRAGNIHVGNIVNNHRVQLLYVVEPEVDKATKAMNKYTLLTKVLPPEEAEQVLLDDRSVL